MSEDKALGVAPSAPGYPLQPAVSASIPNAAPAPGDAPHGWLYDWTHSSALGKPDEQFTGFTKDEKYARGHEAHHNVRPCYLKPQPAAAVAPNPGSPEASAMIDSELAAHNWPTNTRNAARAGYVACMKLMAPAEPSPAPAQRGGVDCIGLALDLEARAKTVESQTTERAMKAAAHGLRLLASAQAPAVTHGNQEQQ